jgi:KDO2-lipid IV(A) lauroyltransferase
MKLATSKRFSKITFLELNLILFRQIFRLIAKLPQVYIRHVGSALGRMIYWTHAYERTIVKNNLHFAFPSWSEKSILKFRKKIFNGFGIFLLETARLSVMSHKDILSHCREISGEEYLWAAIQKGKGVILVSAHIGNWEIGLQGLALYFKTPLCAVEKKLSRTHFYQWLHLIRKRFGTHMIEKENAFPDMLGALRKGEMLCLMMDITRRDSSVDVQFFNHPARATHVASLLSLRCGSPIIPVFSYRDSEGLISGKIYPEVALEKSGNLRKDLEINTQAITSIVEEAIRMHPEQYFWIQKRWKHYYPELYPTKKRKISQ